MYCPNCGRENQDGAKYCGGCGAVLNKVEKPVNSGGGKTETPNGGRRQNSKKGKPDGNGKSKKPRGLIRIIIVLAVVLIALLAATAAVKIYTSKFSPQARWQEQYDLGEQYLLEMDYEQAIVAFTAAIEIDPEETAAYLGRAEAYIGEDIEEASDESLQAALEDYDTVLELAPEQTEAYLGEADIYVVMDDYDSARDILEDGLAYNPDDEELSDRLEEIEEQIEERELFNRYQAYYDKLMELQEEYGEVSTCEIDGLDCLEGLCFAKLLDFNGDGTEELILTYGIRYDSEYYTTMDYSVEVWEYADGEIEKIFEGSGFGTDGGVTTLYITCVDDQYYIIEGAMDSFSYSYIYGYGEYSFALVKTLIRTGEAGEAEDVVFTIDEMEVEDAEWYDEYDSWWNDAVTYLLWYSDWAGTELYRDAENPETELADTLDTLCSLLGIEEEEAEEDESSAADDEPEETSESTENDVSAGSVSWEEFVSSGSYENYIDEEEYPFEAWDEYIHYYAIYDLNADGVDELVLRGQETFDAFGTAAVFCLDDDGDVVLAWADYGYGTLTYCPTFNAIRIPSEIRTGYNESTSQFYQLVGTDMVFLCQYIHDVWSEENENYVIYADGTTVDLGDDADISDYYELVQLDWQELS